jgi:Flp pilus assembly protein TadG
MTGVLVRPLLCALTRFSREERGASAMVVAIALPGLIGFGALGAETGLWYTIKLRNQSAADAAAISAAYEVIAGKTNITDDLMPAASEAAAQNADAGTIPEVVQPYSDGIVSNGIAVTLRQSQGAFLASPFLPGVTVGSKAVAVIKVLDNSCILAGAVEVVSSSSLNARNCSVAANSTSNSAIDLQDDTSAIAAATLVTPGEISFAGNPIDPAAPPSEFILSSRPMIGAPVIADPYANTLTHGFDTTGTPTTPCTGNYNQSTNVTTYAPKGCKIRGGSLATAQGNIVLPSNTLITGGWDIKNKTVDLSSGKYWITNGNFSVAQGAKVTGNGVTIILTTTNTTTGKVGNVKIAVGATATLQAPNSGTFSGLLFIQDTASAIGPGVTYTAGGSSFKGGAKMQLDGLLYFPDTTVAFAGNPSTDCAVLISYQAVIQGNSNFTTAACSTAGLTTLPTVNTAALAE